MVLNDTVAPEVNTTLAVVIFDPRIENLATVRKDKKIFTKVSNLFSPLKTVPSGKKWSKDVQYVPASAVRQLNLFGISKLHVDHHNHKEYQWGKMRATGYCVFESPFFLVLNIRLLCFLFRSRRDQCFSFGDDEHCEQIRNRSASSNRPANARLAKRSRVSIDTVTRKDLFF